MSDREPPPLRVLYGAVRDGSYPRNLRIRSFLTSQANCELVVTPAIFESGTIKNFFRTSKQILFTPGRFDVIVISEFSTKYALLGWFRARLQRSILIVDGFVGLHESEIEDRRAAAPTSTKALVLRALDHLALRTADLYLIDTEVRAELLRARARRPTKVVSLPVGAPAWAKPLPARVSDDQFRLLYYGNFIPLHGVRFVVEAVLSLPKESRVTLTLLGDVSKDEPLRALIDQQSTQGRITLSPPVPEVALRDVISNHDVVLGVFGDSSKAATVIANKVWQGLMTGKPVLTRDSTALSEIEAIVGDQLVKVAPASSRSIVRAIGHLETWPASFDASSELKSYIEGKYLRFREVLIELTHNRSRNRESTDVGWLGPHRRPPLK